MTTAPEFPQELLDGSPYSLGRADKRSALLEHLLRLTQSHAERSPPYGKILDALFPAWASSRDLEELPWLPVSLFKSHELRSVGNAEIVRTLVSSGTSGRPVSRIFLDKDTSSLMSKALARISTDFLGKQRRPMLIIDDDSFLRDRSKFNARAAGILGFSNLGRDHTYALDEALNPDWDKVAAFVSAHGDKPILLFGFTFLVWQKFVQTALDEGIEIKFPKGSALVHGGGWKKLEELAVGNETFKQTLAQVFGIEHVHNYYGMVEQVGSVYFECEAGHLHTPDYSDVIIRDPITFSPLSVGEKGLIQVLSILPRSYCGHSLLTEDLGTVIGEDDCPCGRPGKRFAVHGRIPNVELRGCSDTRAIPA